MSRFGATRGRVFHACTAGDTRPAEQDMRGCTLPRTKPWLKHSEPPTR